jgi:hypothetical protein
MQPKPPVLEIWHAVPGRTRLRPTQALDHVGLKTLAERLAAVPGVQRVVSRPKTGSLILEFDGAPDPILAAITEAGVARVRPPEPPPPIGQLAQFGLLQADMALQERTGKTLDLNTTVALLLMAGAVVQVTRGKIAGPATTLVLGALSMLDRGRRP